MRDPWFERTLVLLCQHNDDGALGLIINREGEIGLQEVIDRLTEDHGEFGSLNNGEQMTWWGGPVGDGADGPRDSSHSHYPEEAVLPAIAP